MFCLRYVKIGLFVCLSIFSIILSSCVVTSIYDDWPSGEWRSEDNTIILDMDTRLGTAEINGNKRRIVYRKNLSHRECTLQYIDYHPDTYESGILINGFYDLKDGRLEIYDSYNDKTLILIRRTDEDGVVSVASEPPKGIWVCDDQQISINFETGQGTMKKNNTVVDIEIVEEKPDRTSYICYKRTSMRDEPIYIIHGTYVVKGGNLLFTSWDGKQFYIFHPQGSVI